VGSRRAADVTLGYLRAPVDCQESFRRRSLETASRYRADKIMDQMLADIGIGALAPESFGSQLAG
jgi:hypothetical protein